MTIEDVDVFINTMNVTCNSELNENALDVVSGGAGVTAVQVLGWACKAVSYTAKGAWNAGRWFYNKFGI
jgi:hypothetical protein